VLVSPDQQTLYVIGNDNGWFDLQTLHEGEKPLQGAHQLQAYDLSPDGQASNRRVLIDYTRQDKPAAGQTVWSPTLKATSGWRRVANGGRASRC